MVQLAEKTNCTNSSFEYNNCCGGCGYSFLNNQELKVAATIFKLNKAKASEQYGIMNCWNVENISDMRNANHEKLNLGRSLCPSCICLGLFF